MSTSHHPLGIYNSAVSRLWKSIGTSIVGQWLDQIWSWSVHFLWSYGVHKLFHHIFTKWQLAAILVFRFSPKSIGFFHSRSSMAVSNMNLICALVSQLRETQALACSGGGRCGGVPDQNHNIPEISNFGDIIMSSWSNRKSYLVIICPNSHEKLTKTWNQVNSVRSLLRITHLAIECHIWSLFSPIHITVDQKWN